MIEVENIGFDIGKESILKEITTTFLPNQISMVIGANGAGKSTLLKVLSQQVISKSGEIYFSGKKLETYDLKEMAKVRAVLSQHLTVAFPLSVQEVVMMGRYPHFDGRPKQNDVEIVKEALRIFDMESFSSRNFQTLSGGEQQRVHFARVAAQIWPENNGLKYLFLDEPLTYLDVFYQYEFMQFLTSFMKKQPLVIVGVVHDLNIAFKYAQKVILMHQGKIIKQGQPKEVFASTQMEHAFKLKPHIYTHANGDEIFSFS